MGSVQVTLHRSRDTDLQKNGKNVPFTWAISVVNKLPEVAEMKSVLRLTVAFNVPDLSVLETMAFNVPG